MQKIIFVLFCSVLAVGQNRAETYDLHTYLDAVKQQSKDLKLAHQNRNLAKVQKKEALSTALPKIGFEAAYNRNLTDYYTYFNMSAFTPGATGLAKVPVKRDNEYSATIALQQTLFSPQVGSAIKAASQYQKLSNFVYDASFDAVITGAKKLYYQCMLLEKVWAVSQSAEINARDNFNNMKLKYDNGQVSQFELLQSETRWRNAVPESNKSKRNWELAMNMLKNMAGIDVNQQITLTGSFEAIPEMPDSLVLDQIFAARPDFNALLWEEKLRKTNVDATKASYLPTLTGTMAYAYSGQSNKFELAEENKFWFAGVKLSLPLFTGGYRQAQVQRAKIELSKSRMNIDKNRENICNEVSNIYLRLTEAHQRIDAARATVQVAEKAFTIAETTAQSGLATQLQLKDARMGFDQSRLNYYASIYDYLEAYFDWEKAVGKVQ